MDYFNSVRCFNPVSMEWSEVAPMNSRRSVYVSYIISFPCHLFICSVLIIHSGYFYSASSSPLLLRGAPDTARILYLSFTPKRYRQLRVKDLSKVLTWRLDWDSTPRPFGRKVSNLPMSRRALHYLFCYDIL